MGSAKSYHADLMHRARILLAALCGHMGKPGGGFRTIGMLVSEAYLPLTHPLGLRHGMRDCITTQVRDYWADAFPSADLHLHSNSYQGWPPEKCRFLTQKSFESLQPGGGIIIHEILLNEDKTGPLAAAAFDIVMLLWTPGKIYTGPELSAMLTEAGFTDIKVKPPSGCFGIVTGGKP